MSKAGYFFILVLLCSALPGTADDFGLEIQQSPEFTNTGTKDSGEVNYTGSYSPWYSSELGQTAKFYLSAKVSTVYEYGEWKPGNIPILFELGRSEILWHPENSGLPISSINIAAGRTPFQDPLGIIAAGLFDGFNGSVVLGQARVSAGAFYTGLLYKETADIVMTPSDALTYIDDDKYFASRRLLFSAGAEFPALTAQSSLAVNALLQVDVNNKVTSLHTQYLSAKYTRLVTEALSLTGALALGMAENKDADMSAHFALVTGADWEVPGDLRDMLQGEIRWSTGAINKSITAFTPVTSISQGQVFDHNLSGLMTFKGKYITRFHEDFSASAEGTYFIRTDDGGTLSKYPSSSDRLFGGELYGSLTWAPVSDLRATIGGGFFFPGAGNVFASDESVWWKLSAGIILSL